MTTKSTGNMRADFQIDEAERHMARMTKRVRSKTSELRCEAKRLFEATQIDAEEQSAMFSRDDAHRIRRAIEELNNIMIRLNQDIDAFEHHQEVRRVVGFSFGIDTFEE